MALAGAVLSIDLGAIRHNWQSLAALVAPVECGATVKADGYGLGVAEVAHTLAAAGCRSFFVALPGEGLKLRDAVPEATVYVLAGLLQGQARLYAEHRLRPCLASLEEVEEWAGLDEPARAATGCALHLDSGINRLGLAAGDVEALARRARLVEGLGIRLVLSHLACADVPSHPMNAAQLAAFARLRGLLPAVPASLANTAACFMDPAFHLDLARPGIGLFGGNPFTGRSNPTTPVVRLYGAILQVREIEAGEHVGYGALWTATRASRIAVVAAGYADGLMRALWSPAAGEQPQAFVAGQYAPIVGRVSMDTVTVDVTGVDPDSVRRGSQIELIGDHVTVDDMARWAGTIPYEILTGLGRRYARVYSPPGQRT